MAELPLSDGIARFKSNEDRVDRFVNGTDTQDFVTSGNVAVPTIRKFLKQKDTDINTAANGILTQSTAARDKSQEWASKAVDSPVETGLFSSRHYAAKAAASKLATDQAVIDANTARDEAQDLATEFYGRNNWIVNGPFVGTGTESTYALSVDPGTVNNMFVIVGGVSQLASDNAYSLIYTSGVPYIRINVPLSIKFEVRIGKSIDVGTPADGTVGTAKLANGAVLESKLGDNSVTFAKMQDIASTRLIGRTGAGAGDPSEVSPGDLLNYFLPVGSIIGGGSASYATNAVLTALIPYDDTVPQNTEGTQILALAITPKTPSSKLRIRFQGQVAAVNGGQQNIIAAIFKNDEPNAIAAKFVTTTSADYGNNIAMEMEYAPGDLTEQLISVRVGGTIGSIRMNGSGAERLLGGVSTATLVIEEIKG